MEVTVAGSGTAVPDPVRVGSGYFVRVGVSRVLLDCGPGVVHHLAKFSLPWQHITHLGLTHFHTDHVSDVPALLFALKYGQLEPRKAPLTIFGPTGTRRFFRRLAAAHGDYVSNPGFPLEIVEMRSGRRVALNDVATIAATATPHTDSSVAFRIDGPQSALGYSGDTDYDVDVGSFLQSLDLLITECSLPDDLAMPGHLTPTRVAALARVALPRRLMLTHLYPQLPRDQAIALVKAAGWEGDTILAEDGMSVVF